jgi:hypothetical protein
MLYSTGTLSVWIFFIYYYCCIIDYPVFLRWSVLNTQTFFILVCLNILYRAESNLYINLQEPQVRTTLNLPFLTVYCIKMLLFFYLLCYILWGSLQGFDLILLSKVKLFSTNHTFPRIIFSYSHVYSRTVFDVNLLLVLFLIYLI